MEPSGSGERRRHQRYKCQIGIYAEHGETKTRIFGHVSEVSMNGCYIEAATPLPVGSPISLTINDIAIKCCVRTSYPGVGMGIEFVEVADQVSLQQLVNALDLSRG